ncbi:NAD(P)/FAD-dependent oxidoreductase [Actinoplanes sp. NPDC051470]|uniref:FAD-dependent oxidoreductase n=1 Tax=Actinoplanes sp. NPDC051470 TaxID=3157224 RepID=UPI00341890CB
MTRAIVAGAGYAGTATALALHRLGWEVEIHEARAEGAAELGAFVTVAVNGIAALRTLGIDPSVALAGGFPTPTCVLWNGAGRRLAQAPLGGPTADGLVTTTIRRADLYLTLRRAVLDAGVPIHYSSRVTEVAHDADLLVGADGINSQVRRNLDPAQPHYLGLLNAGGFTEGPVGADFDPTPGLVHMTFGRRCFFGWSVAPDGSVWWFANPGSRTPHHGSFPGWREHLIDLLSADSGPAAAIVRATPEALGPWNTYDLPKVRTWRSDNVVLVGDAAHAASPSSGQGASMAFEDAVVLGQALASSPSVPAGLACYEEIRRPRVQKVVQAGRRNGSGKAAGPVGAAIRDAMMPAMMRMLYRKGNPQAWILDHRV